MRLDFNETNILVQSISNLEKQEHITKDSLLSFLCALYDNTDENYLFIRRSVKTLSAKIENLSDKNIEQIREDKKKNKIIATVGYILPEM